jgi:RNA polymerase sigma-70 factor (ECF subfamily)
MTLSIKHNQEAFFRDLLDRYFHRLQRFAVTFLGNGELAEEVVMDVFLKLWEKGSSIDSIDNLTTYLFVAVRNTCHNYLRREKKIRFDSLDFVDVQLARYERTPESDLISEEILSKLNQIIETLPPKCKLIFKLLREEGLSRKETAKVLNLSVNTIDNQVAMAVKKIAEGLGLNLSSKRHFSELSSFLLCL